MAVSVLSALHRPSHMVFSITVRAGTVPSSEEETEAWSSCKLLRELLHS